jgi:hypothetical protein
MGGYSLALLGLGSKKVALGIEVTLDGFFLAQLTGKGLKTTPRTLRGNAANVGVKRAGPTVSVRHAIAFLEVSVCDCLASGSSCP